MGAGVASRAGVSAHDLLRSSEPRVGSGRVREEVGKAEEEETERKVGRGDFSSVRLEKSSGLRRGRLATVFMIQNNKKIKSVPFPALSISNKH